MFLEILFEGFEILPVFQISEFSTNIDIRSLPEDPFSRQLCALLTKQRTTLNDSERKNVALSLLHSNDHRANRDSRKSFHQETTNKVIILPGDAKKDGSISQKTDKLSSKSDIKKKPKKVKGKVDKVCSEKEISFQPQGKNRL